MMVEQNDTIRSPTRARAHRRGGAVPGVPGPNHADCSANGRFFVVTCEFSGELLKVATLGHRVLGLLVLDPPPKAPHAAPMGMGRSMPQDVRISPDGTEFFVADMGTNELGDRHTSFRQRRSSGCPGSARHLPEPGREAALRVRPRGRQGQRREPAQPDRGDLDDPRRWEPRHGRRLRGRMDALARRPLPGVVYGFATRTGRLVARIPVGGGPHGLWSTHNPGRYPLGHTGNMR